ncbi:RNA polymerase sigma factor [Sphingobacterium yanglingense]|nr:sigma-70 family RNA polymerase sigma factor [Sphingobacterium yanglingense]
MAKAMSDPSWIERLAAGDQHAFADFYECYWQQVYNKVYRKIQQVEATEDIVHDLFLSIWKNRSRIHEVLNMSAYLMSGARYLTFKYLDKEKGIHMDMENIELILPDPPLEDRLHYRYILDLAHEEIENLPEKCKLIFKESRFNHKTIDEIAMEYGLSKSTVENQINKAIKRIRLKTSGFYAFLYLYL